ncbi:glycoside hydrolase family 29 protein [Xylariomycetidae sp. FL2044]|nr:glycoside hydrolase family 29 protein [Xylariomycetidae sp. FL2044]
MNLHNLPRLLPPVAGLLLLCSPITLPQASAQSSKAQSLHLDLTPFYNNKAFGTYPGEAAFDNEGQSYPAPVSSSPSSSSSSSSVYTSTRTGITYAFPGYTNATNLDNIISQGQVLDVLSTTPSSGNNNETTTCRQTFFSVSFLAAGDKQDTTITDNVTFTYADGSTSVYELRVQQWYSWLTMNRGEIVFPYRFTSTAADADDTGGGVGGVNWNTTHVFESTAPLAASTSASGKTLRSITLPDERGADEGRLHVFAISISIASDPAPAPGISITSRGVNVQSVRPTQKWLDDDDDDAEEVSQVVEVTVNNVGNECVAGKGLTFSLVPAAANGSVYDYYHTTRPGTLRRLCPGDQKTVVIGVRGTSSSGGWPAVDAVLVIEDNNNNNNNDSGGGGTSSSREELVFSGVEIGLVDYTADAASLSQHESPQWFDDAKFGIFIHWGPYSVTGWGNSTPYESYAEWFWWYSTHHPQGDHSNFYGYRLATYGPAWSYDDTFPSFTAAAFDPKAWVDLFAAAGAQYFVLTSKHHDGFALFDTHGTSNRSSLHHGPRRDLLGELFGAAATHQPHLRRGAYFSLPEWYNPDFGPYGFDMYNSTEVPATNSWPGVPAVNPYTGVEEPYTGRVPVADYLEDLQRPQMEILAYEYGIDILWCDIGAANSTDAFAAEWWNDVRNPRSTGRSRRQEEEEEEKEEERSGGGGEVGRNVTRKTTTTKRRQVAVNSRCGSAYANDFDTPEYATFATPQARKWESNRGMDPYSYGYNGATPAAEYMNASTVVYTLVDIVAKNGNLLLDIGPRADGSLVEAEVEALTEAGAWLDRNGEAVFGTRFWFRGSEVVIGAEEEGNDGLDVRFTQTEDAFYVLFLSRPRVDGDTGVVRVPADVPVLDGDVVSLLGVEGSEDLAWSVSDGVEGVRKVFEIEVDDVLLDKEVYCWVFKIQYA